MGAKCARRPGAEWRVLAHDGGEEIALKDRGVFDELVVDHWLHIEQMEERRWWMRVGDVMVMVRVHPDGAVVVDVERGVYGERRGATRALDPSED
ncbi:MAG: hypothetical protein JJ863_07020 [Deltaproteobacteria bacterium]|nr:hypothetical protein [Deltaproteobacteria bacterium]